MARAISVFAIAAAVAGVLAVTPPGGVRGCTQRLRFGARACASQGVSVARRA